MSPSSHKGFTLIELLIVIAVITILAIAVVLVLNPAELLKQGRDSTRLNDMQTLTSALNIYNEDQGGAASYSLGTPNLTYISIPDPTATSSAGDQCQGLGLPALASSTYHCAASSTYRNVSGTGWIPVKLSNITTQPPLVALPVDPTNTTSSGEYYEYATDGTNFEVAATPESQKYSPQSSNFAEGSSQNLIALGGGSSSNPVPTLTLISPNSTHICVTACTGTDPLAVTGTGFVSSSVVYWSSSWVSSTLATTYISSSSMTAQIPDDPELNTQGGTVNITVISPAPGGGTSGIQYFTVTGGI